MTKAELMQSIRFMDDSTEIVVMGHTNFQYGPWAIESVTKRLSGKCAIEVSLLSEGRNGQQRGRT